MNYKIQHNRKMDYSAKYKANAEYEMLRNTPTYKQRKFFKRLCALCRKNGIDVPIERSETRTRLGMAKIIDKLLKLLNEYGVDIHGNGKNAVEVISNESYGSGYRTTRRIVVEESERGKRK